MRWIKEEIQIRLDQAAIREGVLRAAFADAGGPNGLRKLGAALAENGRYELASMALMLARDADPEAFRDWRRLAACHVHLGRYEEALAACDAAPDAPGVASLRGFALERLGRIEEAAAALQAALEQSGDTIVLERLLRLRAGQNQPEKLLALCDALSPGLRDSMIVLGYRAIALSQAGRTREALELVDLDRHVMWAAFDPPAEFGGLDAFNDEIAGEILAQAHWVEDDKGLRLLHQPPVGENRAFEALRDFAKGEIERFVAELPARGLDRFMPPPPRQAVLHMNTNVVRNQGSNGQHLHRLGYVSAVYYVRVPAEVTAASDDRGALLIGAASRFTGGHEACWGVRAVKPVEGQLIVMPSHIFHDVAPTLCEAERISVAFDLRPIES